MKTFYLDRVTDISGASGVGKVAEGVIFGDGTCALRWLSQYTSTAVYKSIEDLEKIHGHDGATRIVYDTP